MFKAIMNRNIISVNNCFVLKALSNILMIILNQFIEVPHKLKLNSTVIYLFRSAFVGRQETRN